MTTHQDTVVENTESISVLILDDEKEITNALTRVLRRDYQVKAFQKGEDALAYLSNHPVSIIISDMRMPKMDGAEFLAQAKVICPDAIRFLLTGYSDMEATIRAINDGGVHTYIAKPWDNEGLKLTLSKACELLVLRQQKAQLTQELAEKNRDLQQLNGQLEEKVQQRTVALRKSNQKLQTLLVNRNRTFKDILSTLSAIIQHVTGQPSDHTERVAEIGKLVAQHLNLPEKIITQVYLCGLIHEIGLIGSSDIHQTTHSSSHDLTKMSKVNPEVGAEIISQIKRFKPLVEIIRHQDENFDGTGSPDHLKEDQIPVAARILRLSKNYEYFISSVNPKPMAPSSARAYIKQNSGTLYDPNIAKAFIKVLESELDSLTVDVCVGLDELKVGSVVKQDVYLPNGQLMITAGQTINSNMLSRLRALERAVDQPIAVFI